jgi:hypothetical protein
MWFPLPVRVYLKPAVSKNCSGFCCGSAPYGWLTDGFKRVRRREWRKNKIKIKIFNKKNFSALSNFSGACNGNHSIFRPYLFGAFRVYYCIACL